MAIVSNTVDSTKFNRGATLPFELRLKDFEIAMQDIYDFFYDVNRGLVDRGLERLDDMLRPAIMSGLLSDMLTASVAKHSRSLTENLYHNGHPDLIVKGVYPGNSKNQVPMGLKSRRLENPAGPSIRMALAISGCVFLCTMSMLLRSPHVIVLQWLSRRSTSRRLHGRIFGRIFEAN
ncbi:MAG TPA: hypothetical protein VFN94_11645 [Nitrospiria bacterium]|nr:hypothetical protein [Nitrospiria bacterium]